MRTAIYFRYSSDSKSQVENSELRQREKLQKVCVEKGWTVVWSGGDEATSGDSDKPKLEELKSKVNNHELTIDCVFVDQFSRLTRRDSLEVHRDVAWIRDNEIKVAILEKGSHPQSIQSNTELLLLQVEVFQANEFLKKLSHGVTSGMAARAERGVLGFSNAPFGYELDKTLRPAWIKPTGDLALVPEVFETVLITGQIMAAVPILKKSEQYRDKNPGNHSVKTILRNPIYIGKRTFGVAGVGKHKRVNGSSTRKGAVHANNVNRLANAPIVHDMDGYAIIDAGQFQKVQNLLDSNKGKAGARSSGPSAKYRYKGLLKCANCGYQLVGESKSKHNNYVCYQSKKGKNGVCPGRKTITEDGITDTLYSLTRKLVRSKQFHEDLHRRVRRFVDREQLLDANKSDNLLVEIEQKEQRLSRLRDLYLNGGSEDDFKQIQKHQNELNQLRESLKPKADDELDFVKRELAHFKSIDWKNDKSQHWVFRHILSLALEHKEFDDYWAAFAALKSGPAEPYLLSSLRDNLTVRVRFAEDETTGRQVPIKWSMEWSGDGSNSSTTGRVLFIPASEHLKPILLVRR